MFTIDFLKNQKLPKKSCVGDAGVLTFIMTASLLLFCLLAVQYFYNNSVLQSKQKALVLRESMLRKSPGQESLISRVEKNINIYNECYLEIANSIGRYVQWTPVLREFADLLPSSMLLNELSVIRTMENDVHDFTSEAVGTVVENYLADLRSSQLLKGLLGEVYILESGDAEFEDSDGKKHKTKKHIINCRLKSQEITGAE